jgi:hypothetical protein
MRTRITTLISETNFRKEIITFRKSLRAILKEYPGDTNMIYTQLTSFYYGNFNKELLIQSIANTVYDFDRVTLARLRKLPRDEQKIELKKIANTFAIEKEFETDKIAFPNVYLPCADMSTVETPAAYCKGSKLMVNTPIDEFISILAADISDDLKAMYLLNNIWMDTIVDQFNFTKNNNEVVTIYRLSE